MWVNAPKGGRSRILSFLFISLAGLSPLSQTKLFTNKLWVVYRTRQSKQCKFLILIFMCLNFTCCPRCHCQIFISEKSLDKNLSLKNIPLWKIFPFKKYPPLKILTPENIHPWKYSPLKIFTPEKYSSRKNIHLWLINHLEVWGLRIHVHNVHGHHIQLTKVWFLTFIEGFLKAKLMVMTTNQQPTGWL